MTRLGMNAWLIVGVLGLSACGSGAEQSEEAYQRQVCAGIAGAAQLGATQGHAAQEEYDRQVAALLDVTGYYRRDYPDSDQALDLDTYARYMETLTLQNITLNQTTQGSSLMRPVLKTCGRVDPRWR